MEAAIAAGSACGSAVLATETACVDGRRDHDDAEEDSQNCAARSPSVASGAGLGQRPGPKSESDIEQDGEIHDMFEIFEKLGEGTYGQVYKAIGRRTRQAFAVKKISIQYEDEGVPSTAIREIALLKSCSHPSVIKLYDIASTARALYLVFEFLDMDLRKLFRTYGPYEDPHALRIAARQCTAAIEYLHEHGIIHRDLKPQNVLIDMKSGRLKVADFGLARAFSVPLRAYTHEVVTLWYRSIELLLGQTMYATPVDIWSLGCLIVEMATAQALFPGDSEIDTIFRIFRVLGTPTDDVWPGVSSLENFKANFPVWPDTQLADTRAAAPALGMTGIQMLQSCFKYDSIGRPSALRLMHHPFFDCTSVAASWGPTWNRRVHISEGRSDNGSSSAAYSESWAYE